MRTERRPRYGALAGIMAGLVFVVLIFVVFSILRLLHAVSDCTEPGGECFDRARDIDEQRIAETRRLVLYVNYCVDAPGRQDVDYVRACLARFLAAEGDQE